MFVGTSRLMMFIFMAQTDKKFKIEFGWLIQRADLVVKTTLQFPVLVGSRFGSVKFASLRSPGVVAIFHSFAPVVCMQEVHPSDVHKNNERLGLESRKRIVESLDCVERCLA